MSEYKGEYSSESLTEYTTLEQLRATMPAYVLGALTAEERAAYEQALRTPENASVMRGEFEACQATVNALANAQPVEPPAELYERVLALVQAPSAPSETGGDQALEASAPVIDRRAADRRSGEERRVDEPQDRGSEERRLEERRVEERRVEDREVEGRRVENAAASGRKRGGRAARTALAARAETPLSSSAVEAPASAASLAGWWVAGVLFLALVGVGYYAATTRRAHAQLDGRLRENSVLLSRSEARLAERERLMATLLGGRASVVLVTMRNSTSSAAAQFFWNAREGRAILNVFGLAPLPPGRRYQLWMLRDGVVTPIIDVVPNDSGNVLLPGIEMPTSTTGVTQLFVTSEPIADRTSAPTFPHLLFGTIDARAALLLDPAPLR